MEVGERAGQHVAQLSWLYPGPDNKFKLIYNPNEIEMVIKSLLCKKSSGPEVLVMNSTRV